MKCPKCNKQLDENAVFCGNCGYDLSADNIMNTLDDSTSEPVTKNNPKKKPHKKLKEINNTKESKKPVKWKLILIIAAAVIIAVGVLIIVTMFGSTEGEKLLQNVPIGRDIAYAESKTERTFTTVSKYNAMKNINQFKSICESDSGLKIEGIHLPEWAIAVSLASDNTINKVTYYDFSQLQKSWKGQKSAAEISLSTVEYGMTEKTVERQLGFKPYSIIKGIDNTTTYIYRYYYSDDVTGNDVVCNYFVVFNDVDGNVKNVYSSELDYSGFMLKVN